MNSLPAAAGLLLVLATGAFSAPITSEPSESGHGGYWTQPGPFDPWAPGWAFHRGHRPHGLDLWAGRPANDQRSQDAGLSQYTLECPASGAPDLEATQPGEDGSDTQIASTEDLDRKSNPIPAVPEPGSLAMLGAGALGLMAARKLLKDQ